MKDMMIGVDLAKNVFQVHLLTSPPEKPNLDMLRERRRGISREFAARPSPDKPPQSGKLSPALMMAWMPL